jgi:hypothetical protein
MLLKNAFNFLYQLLGYMHNILAILSNMRVPYDVIPVTKIYKLYLLSHYILCRSCQYYNKSIIDNKYLVCLNHNMLFQGDASLREFAQEKYQNAIQKWQIVG